MINVKKFSQMSREWLAIAPGRAHFSIGSSFHTRWSRLSIKRIAFGRIQSQQESYLLLILLILLEEGCVASGRESLGLDFWAESPYTAHHAVEAEMFKIERSAAICDILVVDSKFFEDIKTAFLTGIQVHFETALWSNSIWLSEILPAKF